MVTLAFDEGIVGLVGRLAEPINLADAPSHPSFKYVPKVKEERYRAFLGVPIIYRRQLLGVLAVQQRESRQFNETEESFLVTLATQLAGSSRRHSLMACLAAYGKIGSERSPHRQGSPLVKGGWMLVSRHSSRFFKPPR